MGITIEDFEYGLSACEFLWYKDGKTYYEHNELIECFKDLGFINEEKEVKMGMTIENVQQGWQCPICKRVYSSTTMMCMYCGEEGATKTYTTTTTKRAINMFDWDKETDNGNVD